MTVQYRQVPNGPELMCRNFCCRNTQTCWCNNVER